MFYKLQKHFSFQKVTNALTLPKMWRKKLKFMKASLNEWSMHNCWRTNYKLKNCLESKKSAQKLKNKQTFFGKKTWKMFKIINKIWRPFYGAWNLPNIKRKPLAVNFHFKSTSCLEQLGYVVLFFCVMFEAFFFS